MTTPNEHHARKLEEADEAPEYTPSEDTNFLPIGLCDEDEELRNPKIIFFPFREHQVAAMLWVQRNLWFLSPIFFAIHYAAKRKWNFTIAPLIFFLLPGEDGMNAFFAISLCNMIVIAVKDILRQPRPKWLFKSIRENSPKLTCEKSYSTPSAHTVIFTGFQVVFLYFQPGALSGTLFVIVPLLTGLSRMYYGAHYPQDVLLAFALTSSTITVCLVVFKAHWLYTAEHTIAPYMFGALQWLVCFVMTAIIKTYLPPHPQKFVDYWGSLVGKKFTRINSMHKIMYAATYFASVSFAIGMRNHYKIGETYFDMGYKFNRLPLVLAINWLILLYGEKISNSLARNHLTKVIFRSVVYALQAFVSFFLFPAFMKYTEVDHSCEAATTAM